MELNCKRKNIQEEHDFFYIQDLPELDGIVQIVCFMTQLSVTLTLQQQKLKYKFLKNELNEY